MGFVGSSWATRFGRGGKTFGKQILFSENYPIQRENKNNFFWGQKSSYNGLIRRSLTSLRGAFRKNFGFSWDFVPTGFPKRKKQINVCFAFQAILSILFVHEKFHFFGWDDKRGGPIPSWIDTLLTPHLCIVCFITFLAIYQGKLSFGQFWQNPN